MAENLTASNLFFAIAGGFVPSLLWLWFWLKEDSHPEPRSALISTFVAGMIVVPLAMILEYIVSFPIGLTGGLSLLVWAFIEEILKYAAAKKTAFCKSCFDEPVDAIIYMIDAPAHRFIGHRGRFHSFFHEKKQEKSKKEYLHRIGCCRTFAFCFQLPYNKKRRRKYFESADAPVVYNNSFNFFF